MELHDYLRILRQQWVLVLATTVATVAVALGLTVATTPQYSSQSQVFISTAPTDATDAYQGGLFSQQRVASYADAMTGIELSRRVVDQLHLKMTPKALAQKVTATAVPDTVLLQVSVTDPSPRQAQRINQALIEQLGQLVQQIETPAGRRNPLLKSTIIDPASYSTTPVSPKPVRNIALGVVLGLLLGFGLAVLRELLDTTIKDGEVSSQILGAPMMAGISFDAATRQHPLITTLGSHAARVESFRVLRTNLQFMEVDSPTKTFSVTSALPGEGKSTTAVNVALAMAQGHQRVLLLDGDLRRPQVADMLGLEKAVGLTTVLVGQINPDEAVQRHDSGLDVLTSGRIPPNPAELLQSQAMKDLLGRLRDRYDVIVVDSPPLLPVTDASLIASITDGALLVVRHGKTTKDQVAGCAERLAAVGAHCLGVVLNMVPAKSGGRYGYGYGYGYGYAPTDSTDVDRSIGRRADTTPATRGEVRRFERGLRR